MKSRLKMKKPSKKSYLSLEFPDGEEKVVKKIRGTLQTQSKKVVVPQNLPKFRQNGQLKEPTEFLEAFYKVMKAHNIPLQKYLNLLLLYLDTIDS
jgi:hypothetical protein